MAVSSATHYLRLNNISTATYKMTTSIGTADSDVNQLMTSVILPTYQKLKVIRFMTYNSAAMVSCSYLVGDGNRNVPHIICCTATSVTWANLPSFDYIATSTVPAKTGSALHLIGV